MRRGTGVALVALATLPLYRLLPGTAPGSHALQLTERYARIVWTGALVFLVAGALVGVVVRGPAASAIRRAGRWITAPSGVPFAAALGLAAGGACLAFTVLVLEGKPPFLDAMAQLAHARYLAAGFLAGPVLEHPEFWMFQNLVGTEAGWLSQYPPGHPLLLALGLRLSAVELVGPVMAAVAAFFTALAAERLLPNDPVAARVGALLAALSPFTLFLAGAFMSHVSAAAFAALALYCAVRARDEGLGWAVGAGAAAGAMFAVRPLGALVLAPVLALTLFRGGQPMGAAAPRYLRRLAAVAVGGMPFGVGVALYNARFFGSPFTFGYIVAQGPSHGLGFHPDPWGNLYGLREAIAYTASDLVALSVHLLQTPFPVVALIGVYLVAARRLEPGERTIAAWAVLPVVANFFYWHHDLIMGPRMLAEAAPAWGLLAAVAGVGLVRRAPARLGAGGFVLHARTALAATLLLAATTGLAYFAPRQALRYGQGWQAASRLEPPATFSPALVFVHEGWSNRLGARLAGRGLRQDRIVQLLATTPPCDVQRRLDEGGDPSTPASASSSAAAECRREARADRFGTAGLPALLWRGDLPGLRPRGPMFVRDLGPERNRRLLERYPDRRPFLLLPATGPGLRLLPYREGVQAVWADPGAGGAGGE